MTKLIIQNKIILLRIAFFVEVQIDDVSENFIIFI